MFDAQPDSVMERGDRRASLLVPDGTLGVRLAVGDFDADGVKDLAVAALGTGVVYFVPDLARRDKACGGWIVADLRTSSDDLSS